MMASLDHAMWFHRPFRADEWLLYDQDTPSASGGRGLGRGAIFTRDGHLAVSVVQEGLIRVIADEAPPAVARSSPRVVLPRRRAATTAPRTPQRRPTDHHDRRPPRTDATGTTAPVDGRRSTRSSSTLEEIGRARRADRPGGPARRRTTSTSPRRAAGSG